MVYIILFGRKSMELFNKTLVSDCDLNSIFFGQLYKTDIMFYNNSGHRMLIKGNKIIAKAKQY